MTDKAIETQLVDLERQYWEAIRNKDVDAAMRLEGKPVTVEAADTSTWTAAMVAGFALCTPKRWPAILTGEIV